jgi:hypothetical protein
VISSNIIDFTLPSFQDPLILPIHSASQPVSLKSLVRNPADGRDILAEHDI